MNKGKSNIEEELNHIKNSINDKSDNHKFKNEQDYILLNKIVSKNDKSQDQASLENDDTPEKISDKKFEALENKKKTEYKKQSVENKKPIKINTVSKKNKDPVAALVDREIKPIIKKWINKNLKVFVKTIVIQEMKLISKATQKHK